MIATTTPTAAISLRSNEHVKGPETARLLLIEYGDFQCPTCQQAAPVVDMLLSHFDGQIQFAFRHFPLEDLHPQALLAAEAAESAGDQGRFWDMHQILFQNQQRLRLPELERYAGHLGLDIALFQSQMNAHTHLARIRSDIESGLQSHVRSTPGFLLNGKIQDVSFGMLSLRDAIQKALS
jgi:protein-disulfide isomerase